MREARAGASSVDNEAPRASAAAPAPPPHDGLQECAQESIQDNLTGGAPIDLAASAETEEESPWPDLVLIDGGRGQLSAAQEALAALGITDVPLVGVAKGPERDAGLETFFTAGREPFKPAARSRALFRAAPA